MAHYANQKTFTIHRIIPERGGGQFLQIYSKNIAEASRILTPVAFKLYLYLASNQDNYTKDYSPRDFSNLYGVSYDAARKAPQALIDAGYLVQTDNGVDFFETPQERRPRLVVEPERRKYKDFVMTYEEVYEDLKEGGWLDSRIEDFWTNEMEVIK